MTRLRDSPANRGNKKRERNKNQLPRQSKQDLYLRTDHPSITGSRNYITKQTQKKKKKRKKEKEKSKKIKTKPTPGIMQQHLTRFTQQGRLARNPQVRHDGLCMKSESKPGPDPNLGLSLQVLRRGNSRWLFAFYFV
jgi:hypothetical protein